MKFGEFPSFGPPVPSRVIAWLVLTANIFCPVAEPKIMVSELELSLTTVGLSKTRKVGSLPKSGRWPARWEPKVAY